MDHDKDSISIHCSTCDYAINVSPDSAFNDLGWEDRQSMVSFTYDSSPNGQMGWKHRILCPHCVDNEDNGRRD